MIATEQSDDTPLKTTKISLPSRDQITSVQVNTLLNAVQGLSSISRVTEEDGGVRDGGTLTAIETAIIKACTQLENIFEDSTRWGLDHQNVLEKQLSDVYKTHLSVMEEQKKAFRAANAPHRFASPKLARLSNGQWAAIVGDHKNLENCILGLGDSPAAAMENFDSVFAGLIEQAKQEPNEQKQLDTGTVDGASETAGDGSDVRGDSEATGPDSGELPPAV